MEKKNFATELTIKDINNKQLNKDICMDFIILGHDYLTKVEPYLDNLMINAKYENGRKVRLERRESMSKVLKILYSYVNLDTTSEKFGECSPSFRTLAYKYDPTLEKPSKEDTPKIAKQKERRLMTVVMLIQRTVYLLAELGFIKIHEYRADTNKYKGEDTYKNPNFFYQLVPLRYKDKEYELFIQSLYIETFEEESLLKRLKNKAQQMFYMFELFLNMYVDLLGEKVKTIKNKIKNRKVKEFLNKNKNKTSSNDVSLFYMLINNKKATI